MDFVPLYLKTQKQNYKDSEYTLAIRGTEFKLRQIKDLINDYYIGTNNDDLDKVIEQYFDMLIFYEETLKPLLQGKRHYKNKYNRTLTWRLSHSTGFNLLR